MTTLTTTPTFVDLRAMAADAVCQPAFAGDPFGAGATVLPVRAGPCEVGVIVLPEGEGSARIAGGDTFLLALEGAVAIRSGESAAEIAAGESCGVFNGSAISWRSEGPARLVFMRYTGAPETGRGIAGIDNGATLSPSAPPAADVLTSAVPSCRANTMFASDDQALKCGVWDSTPYQRRAIVFRHSELMHLLAGEVVFTDAEGRTGTFRAGDTLIMEQGAECTWESYGDVAKIYSTWRQP